VGNRFGVEAHAIAVVLIFPGDCDEARDNQDPGEDREEELSGD
jgi:hypothetical protein